MRRVEFNPSADRDLENLPPDIRERVLRRLIQIRDVDTPIPGLPLAANLRGMYKLRFGDYRLVYEILDDGQLLMVWAIGHRRSI